MPYATSLVQHDADRHVRRRLAYHWRPEDYLESDDYLSGGDPPRWQARHICRLGAGVFGTFDWDASPQFADGDSVTACAQAEGRNIGPVQLKAAFPSAQQQPGGLPWTMTVAVRCVLVDESTEDVRVTLPKGSTGPADPSDPHDWGDLVRIGGASRYLAEGAPPPYVGANLYVDVADVQTVAHSQLAQGIGQTETVIPVLDGTLFESDGGIVKIDQELILYGGVSGNSLVNCVRGYDDPTLGNSEPASHQAGANVDGQYPGCAFHIWSDGPALHSPSGVEVPNNAFVPYAAHVWAAFGNPHYFEDSVGQIHRVYVRDGDVYLQQRFGVPGQWSAERRLTYDGDSDYPCGGKDERNVFWLVRQVGARTVRLLTSVDDGRTFEEPNTMPLAEDLSYPLAVECNGILYVVGYRAGAQYIRRTADFGATFLKYPDGSTERQITNRTDAQRVAFVKLSSGGRRLVVGVPNEPDIDTYVSDDDGGTWVEV